MAGMGFGFHLGFPNGRPRVAGDGGVDTTKRLAGRIDASPTFSARLEIAHNLEGQIDTEKSYSSFRGALDPMRLLYGRVDTAPQFTADLERTIGLRGSINANPTFSGEIEEPATGVVLIGAGTEETDNVISIHPSTAVGDLVLVLGETANEAYGVPAAPTGFTELFTANNGGAAGGATSTRLYVWYKFWDADDEPPIYGGTPAANHTFAIALTFRNVGAAPTAISAAQSTTGTTSISLGAITTTVDNATMLMIAAIGTDSDTGQATTFNNTGGLIDPAILVNENAIAGNGGGIVVASGQKATAGVVSPGPTISLLSSQPWVCRAIQLTPV